MNLQIRNLSKTYQNGVQALKDVSLEIPTGMFGLLGPNGAGKSTLMRTIATLQEPDEGEVFLDGIDVLKEKTSIRKLLGYLPQSFGVYPDVSAEKMLDHFARLKGIQHKGERKDMVKALLDQTNLYKVRNKKIGGFSGGMKQRFGIAQALIGSPKLIIVDEPTAGLDPSERRRFHNLLSEIGENVIIILSTHIVEDVSDLCQNMAIIHRGEVIATGTPVEFMKAEEGKIWETIIEKEDLVEHQQTYNLVQSRHFGGKFVVRAYGEEQPAPHFESSKPTLEDIYFLNIKATESQAAEALPTS